MVSKTLVLILGDQLSRNISSLRGLSKSETIILMAEVAEEATYARHHKKKIAYLFSAMRHFAAELRKAGWQLEYTELDDEQNTGSLRGEVARALKRHKVTSIRITEPGEYRLLKEMGSWASRFGCDVDIRTDDRFIASHSDFAQWARGRKALRMEYFYREMRKKTGLLMNGSEPEGRQWNYDAENRKSPREDLTLPDVPRFEPDEMTKEVIELVAKRFSNHFGDLEPFWFAVTSADAEKALDSFIEKALPRFGDFQDAMLTDEPFLYHSVLSLYMNAGLLDPLAVCRRAANAYEAGQVPLNAAEGFIRQIIGWREFVRGIYWMKMPDYAQSNYFGANRKLPDFYWTGETDMFCLRQAITQTREEAYAHHIQRLMVTGNFAMLAGVTPEEINEWYLIVYADAYEWVEMPNVIGMSQFADGGIIASKPYASSGNYIARMSNYCESCRYDVKQKTGEEACPFNSLYWDFLDRNREKLSKNPRLATIYSSWDRMGEFKQNEYRQTAKYFLDKLE